MKTILKSGFKSFVASCNKCGCKFKYELSDIDTGFVNCPECDNDVFHSINNVTKENNSGVHIKFGEHCISDQPFIVSGCDLERK